MIKPYFEDKHSIIYYGDCQEIIPLLDLTHVDLVLTDPPYGINGGKGTENLDRGKGNYSFSGWEDTPEYIKAVCIPVISHLINMVGRVIVTPGVRNLHLYPPADDIGCFWTPAAAGWGKWGRSTYDSILYYGKDPRAGRKGLLTLGRNIKQIVDTFQFKVT